MMYIKELIERYPVLAKCEKEIREAKDAIIKSYENEGKLLICGNGGSCADSDHICGELLKSFVKKRIPEKSFLDKLSEIDSSTGMIFRKKENSRKIIPGQAFGN